MSIQRMSHMDALHKVAREQDVRPGFQLLDRIADRELHIAAQEKYIDELKQIVEELVWCMDTQEKRKSEEFHLSAEAFVPIWDNAKARAIALLRPTNGGK